MSEIPEKSIIYGAGRLLRGIPNVAGFIIGLTGIAYLLGWIYAKSYYEEFGATWLLGEIPLLTILGFSWWPVAIVVFFAYLGISDLAELELHARIENNIRFKISLAILRYGIWVFFSLMILNIFLLHDNVMIGARIVSYLLICVIIAMVTCAIEVLAVRLLNLDKKVDLTLISLSSIVIFFGLYLTPIQMGKCSALNDKDPKLTRLSTAKLKEEPHACYLVLFAKEDRIYVFPKETRDEYPSIRIVRPEDIISIQKKYDPK
ncbi:MAG: hypothetical protein JW810_05985 [Sedimentisphaerales bacterium]|nr:hypothetical protein [Sedimentisphaerales bacterium]